MTIKESLQQIYQSVENGKNLAEAFLSCPMEETVKTKVLESLKNSINRKGIFAIYDIQVLSWPNRFAVDKNGVLLAIERAITELKDVA